MAQEQEVIAPGLQRLGVVGCGIMGCGIAQIAAQAGLQVLLFDAQPDAAARARQQLLAQWNKLQDKGKLDAATVAQCTAALQIVSSLDEFARCDIVVEAIVEQLDAKRELLARLDAVVAPDCILASNTSSLSITAIAAGSARPQRMAGFHFFNPVPLMKVVEVIPGTLSDESVVQQLCNLAQRMGHRAVRASDTPGFIVNHAGRGYVTEALRIVQEGVADFAAVDAILRGACGFRLGPFELLDLTGLDVSHPVMESIYSQYYQEPRYRPSLLTRQRLTAGLLGRKSGRGFYDYANAAALSSATPSAATPAPASILAPASTAQPATLPSATTQSAMVPASLKNPLPGVGNPATVAVEASLLAAAPALLTSFNPVATPPVWIGPCPGAARAQIEDLLLRCGVTAEGGDGPGPQSICLVVPLGEDVSSCVERFGLDASRTLGIDVLADCLGLLTLMKNPATCATLAAQAVALFERSGQEVSLIADSYGFIAQRVLAMIINIACDMLQQGICSPPDLDAAVTLGLAYPRGPLAWGDALGPRRVLTILQNLARATGDPRYRPSPWLTRRVQLGLSLLHVNN